MKTSVTLLALAVLVVLMFMARSVTAAEKVLPFPAPGTLKTKLKNFALALGVSSFLQTSTELNKLARLTQGPTVRTAMPEAQIR